MHLPIERQQMVSLEIVADYVDFSNQNTILKSTTLSPTIELPITNILCCTRVLLNNIVSMYCSWFDLFMLYFSCSLSNSSKRIF
jgi:hypothetical protein